MRIIGLCGRSGSGKSECGRIISDMGISVIDTDLVYRRLTEKGSSLLGELTAFYGDYILDTNGSLYRKRLAEIVFKDDIMLDRLNAITHKHILKNVLEWAEKAAPESMGGLVVVQAPLLFESGFDKRCDITICVIATDEHCLRRLQSRDMLSEQQAILRLSKHKSNTFLRENCDYTINNDSGITELRIRTQEVFDNILGGKNN